MNGIEDKPPAPDPEDDELDEDFLAWLGELL